MISKRLIFADHTKRLAIAKCIKQMAAALRFAGHTYKVLFSDKQDGQKGPSKLGKRYFLNIVSNRQAPG